MRNLRAALTVAMTIVNFRFFSRPQLTAINYAPDLGE
jgi:hypothetical protein